ncbi:restriction endonuclease subunit S [Aneurinibacillus sp. Ricciae_BoGa-3]|uniref:restriction endonuclease subunit S n=1 Tax=Aneurinibacillus sp. Ricciae_BoGa-3 TaxID=3022697 RepID=UPI00234031C2|nr:restriction endonuclease subunit S [Aneurinibacillus sp. Ricciae_BoGa-3]WCK53915.1 restriction endonuclease subunit S [Aneurinibacillus sp. Ricciae_BoGa-3]
MMREGWFEVKLGDVCFTTSGGTPSRKIPDYYNGNIPWVKSGELNYNVIRDTEEHISDDAIKNSSAKVFPEGTLLIALYGATIGKLAILGIPAATNQAVCGIYQNDHFETKFLFNYLFHKKQKLIEQGAGGAQPNISQTILKKLSVPIAPLPEQRAIVAKIEKLFSELDNGITNLKKAKEKLKIYRQAVLQKAFEGELTKEWRQKKPNLPTADELLEQIQEERLKRYENQLQDWKEAVKQWEDNGKEGKRPTRISKHNTLDGLTETEIENYGCLPEKWSWTRFCNVTYKIGDIDHKMPKDYPDGMPYLSTGNLKADGTIDFDNAKTISPEDFYRLSLKIKPEKGDIIFPRYGTIGRNILINTEKKFLVSYSCAIIKNILNFMDEKFVYYYSVSPIVKKEIKRYTVQTTQANVGISSIEMFVFPLCSKQEQIEIVKEIETRLSVCDNILTNIEAGLEKAEALRQSILKKAFQGRLLSDGELEACRNEPDWQLAEKLLDRIKHEGKGMEKLKA